MQHIKFHTLTRKNYRKYTKKLVRWLNNSFFATENSMSPLTLVLAIAVIYSDPTNPKAIATGLHCALNNFPMVKIREKIRP